MAGEDVAGANMAEVVALILNTAEAVADRSGRDLVVANETQMTSHQSIGI